MNVETSRHGEHVPIPEQILGEARPLRVITIGAGASGLNTARQIDKHMQQVEHVVYEKNAHVDGT
ncbi:hypothetical protein JDV02_007322 [Purpureocillium takamizusanense]|uniref:Flavin-containing monooxygenase n=1 Tax=Purpureocillium takamizusanense TaxID=2060973 RepID=A0A9Q8QKB6_9HYPO|nr:uncharacterized protein JDV02_007322 [Purpureocillium takamizusanense]UNI21323.1 hypothetical protein JDV02_007322 [Purpureocillium takamizusanense]